MLLAPRARAVAAAMRLLEGRAFASTATTPTPSSSSSVGDPSYTVLPPGSSMAEPSYVPPPSGALPPRSKARRTLIRLSGAARRKPLLSHDNPSSTFGLPPGSSVSDPKYSFSLRDPVYAVDPK